MATGTPKSARFNERDLERIRDFRERFNLKDESEAIKEMVRTADRETRSPLLYRIKARGADAAFYFALASLVSAVIGVVTPALSPRIGVQIGIVFLAVGLGALASVELLRTVNGQTDIGARLREVLR